MNGQRFSQRSIGVVLALVFLVGCASPTLAPASPSTFPTSPPTFTLPATPGQPMQPAGLFKLIQAVQVTPVGDLPQGAFVKIGYVPGRGRIVVTFNSKDQRCGNGYAYREYTEEMQDTGNASLFYCDMFTDTGALFTGDDFYLATQSNLAGVIGWQLTEFSALTWIPSASFFQPMAVGEDPGDPMLALVNRQLVVSAAFFHDTSTRNPFIGDSTFIDFFTTDLQFISKRVLSDTPHINLNSMITVDDVINLVTGTALIGDLIVMQYDSNWNYLGTKILKKNSGTPEGVAFDGKRFYISYLDEPCTNFPCYNNVRLAAFDSSWNLLEDIAVTSSTPPAGSWTGSPARPSLTLWNGRLYVCYDDTNGDPSQIPQAYVKVYELTPNP